MSRADLQKLRSQSTNPLIRSARAPGKTSSVRELAARGANLHSIR